MYVSWLLFCGTLLVASGCQGKFDMSDAESVISRLSAPLKCTGIVVVTHSGFGGLAFSDAHAKEFMLLRSYGQDAESEATAGTIWFAHPHQRFPLDCSSAAAGRLLELLRNRKPSVPHDQTDRLVDEFISQIERAQNRPNKALQPTATAVTPRAGARVAPSVAVAEH